MKNTLLFTFIFISTIVSAQNIPTIDWERTFGSRNNDIAHDVIETSNGEIAIVGETQGSEQDGKDGLLVLLDQQGTSILEVIIADKGNEAIHSVMDLGNGELILAGYSENKTRRSGWLVKVNFDGEIIWNKKYGKATFNEFSDVILTNNGNIIAVGTTNGNGSEDGWMIEVDAKGDLKWQKVYGGRKTDKARAIVSTNDGYAITGVTNSQGAGKSDAWLVKTDFSGNLKWENAYGGKKIDEGFSIQNTETGFLIAGFHANGKKNAWLIGIDKRGKLLWQKEFGGSASDEAHTLIKTYDENYVLAGVSGAKDGNQMWLTQVNITGQQKVKDQLYGGRKDESINAILQTGNGDLIAVGNTNSNGLGGNDFWVVKLKTGFKPSELQPSEINASIVGLTEQNKNQVLDAGERGALQILVKNEGDQDVYNLIGNVSIDQKLKGLYFSKKVNVGFLKAGTSKTVLLPIEVTEKIKSVNLGLNIQFSDDNKSSIASVDYDLAIEEIARVHFKVTHQTDPAILGKAAIIKIKVKNLGKKEAQSYRLNFIANNKIIPMSSNGMSLPSMRNDDEFDATFKFEVDKSYEHPTIPLVCILKAPNGDTTRYIAKVEVKSSIDADMYENVETVVRWYSPDIDFYREKLLKISNERLYIKLKIESRKKIKRKDLVMTIDGKPFKDGSKFDEGSLISAGKNRREFHVFTYVDTIEFSSDGVHTVALKNKKSDEIISEELKVKYSGKKPNLYVLSVGTKTNLEYTMQDAKDFAALYQKQAGGKKLFSGVEVISILGEEATASNILGAIEDMEIKFKTGEITKNDMIIIFMSSHGFMIRGDFYIQGDNYQTGRHRTRAVRYSDMIEILEYIPCKKLVFIDACHSGGAKGIRSSAINRAIQDLNEQQAGTTTIVSSASDELSYEDKTWKNGAFTEAIMKAMKGKADKNRDKVLTINEFFFFIKKEVPKLVDKVKQQPQNPQMVNSELNNVPIYILK